MKIAIIALLTLTAATAANAKNADYMFGDYGPSEPPTRTARKNV